MAQYVLLGSFVLACCFTSVENFKDEGRSQTGDFIIGALFPITSPPECKTVNREGLELVQSVIYGVELLNSRRNVLYNKTIGFDIRDTCSLTNVALKQAIDMARNGQKINCKANSTGNCRKGKLIAILGPVSLEAIILSGSILGFYNIPQLIFTPPTRLLSNPAHYRTVLSVAPSISDEMSAIGAVVKRFGWTCVNVIASDDMYGRQATATLRRVLNSRDVCVSTDEIIRLSSAHDSSVDAGNVITSVKSKPQVSVTILLAAKDVAKIVLNEARRQNLSAHVWIGNEAWTEDGVIATEFSDVIGGSLGLSSPQSNLAEFKNYAIDSLRGLTYCDWLSAFKGVNMTCQSMGYHGNRAQIEPASLSYKKHTYVMNALLAIAHVLKTFTGSRCSGKNCIENVTSAHVARKLKTLSFTDGRQKLEFVQNHLKIKTLLVENLQKHGTTNAGYTFSNVGAWTKNGGSPGHLHINETTIQWPGVHNRVVPFSGCSKRCLPGTFVEYSPLSCLWKCVSCPRGTISQNITSHSCSPCLDGKIPNKENTKCLSKQYTYLQHFDTFAIVILTGSAVGELLTIAVLVIFLRFQRTPVVKASNMGFSVFTLVLLLVWFIAPMLFIGRPNSLTCKARTILIPILYTSVSAFLLTKTKRLIQIFSAFSKNRFLSNYWYSFVAGTFILVQAIFCGVYLFYFPPKATQVHVANGAVLLHCSRDLALEITSFSYNCVLAGLCATFAFKSRNLPETYSEAKHICFTMLSYMISWVIYFVGYYGNTSGTMKEALPSLGIILGAYAVLLFIFLPKIGVIFFEPEKNTKKAAMEGARRYSIDVANVKNYHQSGARERRHTLAVLPTYQGTATRTGSPPRLIRAANSLVLRNAQSCLAASIKESDEESGETSEARCSVGCVSASDICINEIVVASSAPK